MDLQFARNLAQRLFIVLLASAAVLLGPQPASADSDHVYVSAGGEIWLGDESGGHGFGLVHWRRENALGDARLDVVFNTDTLRAGLSAIPLADNLTGHVRLAAEYPFAGILPDYFRRGERIPRLGFNAGYAKATAGVTAGFAPHFLTWDITARRWFFAKTDDTDDALVLPTPDWVVEPRLNYTFWSPGDDSSLWEPHQPFPRVNGFAAGATVGIDLRSNTEAWGGPPYGSRRNDPDRVIGLARQWAMVGFTLVGPVRMQLQERAGWQTGGDDLTRDRLGGMNPYVAPIAGLPWASLLSERYVTGRAELRIAGPWDSEAGIFADGAYVADIRRTGDIDDFSATGGVGLLADARFGKWKADVRVGTAFSGDWLASRPDLAAWVSAGRKW